MKGKEEILDTSLPISDENLEKNIIAHILNLSSEQIHEIREIIETEYFYYDVPRNIWRLVCKFNDDGLEITPMLLAPEIMKRNICELSEFMDLTSYGFLSIVDLMNHIPVLVDYAKRRKLWFLAQMMLKNGISVGADVGKVIEEAQIGFDEILHGKGLKEVKTLKDTLEEVQHMVDDNLNGVVSGRRYNTGFDWLDRKGGMQTTDLIILAAASSMGKTSLADTFALNIIRQGGKLFMVSMEMTRQQLTARLLSHYAKVNSNAILTTPLQCDQLKKFDVGVGQMLPFADNLIFADDSVATIDSIIVNIRKMKAKYDICGCVIDYLQLIGGLERGQSIEQFRASCARRLKNIAKELNIFVIALSQLNRDKESFIPTLERLRDSGQIGEAADVVLMIYRPEYYNMYEGKNLSFPAPFENVSTEGTAQIFLAKGRNIGVGSFICGFNANETHFYDLQTLPNKTTTHIENNNFNKNENDNLPF